MLKRAHGCDRSCGGTSHHECDGSCGGTFICAGCGLEVGWCLGAADNMPDHCNDCWYANSASDEVVTSMLQSLEQEGLVERVVDAGELPTPFTMGEYEVWRAERIAAERGGP